MKNRAITFLLATLLALVANATVPAARGRTSGSDSAIVWIAQDRGEKQLPFRARAIAKGRPAAPPPYLSPANPPPPTPALYQRPPPSLR